VIEDISKVEVVGPPFPDHVTSEAGVPLRSGGRVIGVLDVGSGPQRPLTQADVELLEIAAERVATAIERSRAYEIERTERSRSELVGRVSEIINQAGSLPEQLEELAGLFCADLADCCLLTVLSDVNDALQACAHRIPQLQAKVREAAQRIYHDPLGGTAARSQIFNPRDMTAGADGDRQLRDLAEELDLASVLTAQLRGVSGPVGRIVLGRTAASPRFEADEVHLMDDVAGRMGTAIASRLTFERHRDTAITLQRSLLPSKLPAIQGLEVAARYWPASVSFEVGGDFYDVIELEPDRWGIIVGDVSGKGVEAAAMTGIARHTARAAARHGIGPAGVLQWVHEAFLEQAESTETYCTAVFGLLDRLADRFVFRFAIGGHPLPILRPARGTATFVGRPGTVLGLIDPIELVETEVVLEREDSLFIYTDGVTDVPVANAITEEELIEIVEASSALSAADSISSLDEVLRSRYGHYENRDDTAVLVLKHSTAESGDLRGHLTRSGIEN
jgi:serine phosphatase RsbU (regulator of sigma subunit)